jgi:hypothetical protein
MVDIINNITSSSSSSSSSIHHHHTGLSHQQQRHYSLTPARKSSVASASMPSEKRWTTFR